MRIALIHDLMFNSRTWERVAGELILEGLELELWPQMSLKDWGHKVDSKWPDLVIFKASPDLPGYDECLELCKSAPKRVALTPEAPEDFCDLDSAARAQLYAYLDKAHQRNFANGIRYVASLFGSGAAPGPPEPVTTFGIYHPGAKARFSNTDAYLDWLTTARKITLERNLVAVLFYYGALVEQNLSDLDRLVEVMEQNGLAPMCIFTEGMGEVNKPFDKRYPWWKFIEKAGPRLAALCNYTAGRFFDRPDETARLREIDLPVFQLIRVYGKTPEEWLNDPVGVPSHSLTYAVAQPEMAGVIEPMVVAAQAPAESPEQHVSKTDFLPIPERMQALCGRIKAWIRLKELPNRDKRLTVVLNNPPCKGAEATVGQAAGLDAFESLAALLNELRAQGYDLEGAPDCGDQLREALLSRKAISEFRWTTVDEIVRKGGALYLMDQNEYLTYFDTLPARVREKLIEDWEEFPGQGMVLEEPGKAPRLVISGIKYGKLTIMVQPKRGCYGAKCNGEVCRILHDPTLAPPHHWLAAYKYIRDNSDAVIHFGTEGALEYLPGKPAGLSNECFPEVSLQDLPNLYPYLMDIPGEGLIAKRRARAVLIDHLTPVYTPAPQDRDSQEAADLLDQYNRARALGETSRTQELESRLRPLLAKLSLLGDEEVDQGFGRAADTCRRALELARQALCPLGLHVLGIPPDVLGLARMLATILARPNEELPDLAPLLAEAGKKDTYPDRVELLQKLLSAEDEPGAEVGEFTAWARGVAGLVNESSREIPQILKGLSGGYLEPGLAGSVYQGKTQALPTGRNFFAMDPRALPTPAAWQVGCELAGQLLRKYWCEEGRFPESVGQNLWSMDAFISDGEVLSQILCLMGVRPVWDSRGTAKGVEAIDLSELFVELKDGAMPRPRVDVLVQTSGIVRDMLPNFLELIDQAVELVGGLDEPEEENYILKHNRQRLNELKEESHKGLIDDKLKRLACCRIFSSPPGSYGIGVGLALDASAWQDEADLAEVYVNWGGYAYGGGEYGREARQAYAGHLANLDLTYMKQYSAEYDLVDCGCYASYQGGMAQAASAIGGKKTKLYWSSNPVGGETRVDDFSTGLKAALGAKLFNPAWLSEMKKHGYQGAAEVSGKVNNLFKWSATSKEVDKEVFDGVVQRFLRDADTLAWLRQNNPHALEELTRRLLEAQSRGLWQAGSDDLGLVQTAALSVEGDLEESMGQVEEEFQGADVEVLTAGDVEKWRPGWTFKPKGA
jgi:cobaltochelatase CobN